MYYDKWHFRILNVQFINTNFDVVPVAMCSRKPKAIKFACAEIRLIWSKIAFHVVDMQLDLK